MAKKFKILTDKFARKKALHQQSSDFLDDPTNLQDLTSDLDEWSSISNSLFAPVSAPEIPFKDNAEADQLDNKLRISEKSEDAYINIASQIVETSSNQLADQNRSKASLKKIFTIFFICFISAQYAVLAFLLILSAFFKNMTLSETVIITYMSSVFIETLGAIILMIRYAFNSAQEVQILKILNQVISSYKKYDQK